MHSLGALYRICYNASTWFILDLILKVQKLAGPAMKTAAIGERALSAVDRQIRAWLVSLAYWRPSLAAPPRTFLMFILLALQTVAHLPVALGPDSWRPFSIFLSVALWLVWFGVLFLVATPSTDHWLSPSLNRLKWVAVVVGLTLALIGVVEIVGVNLLDSGRIGTDGRGLQTANSYTQHFGYNDGTALTHAAGDQLLDGRNPYSGLAVHDAFDRFGLTGASATPLRQGEFEQTWPYPDAGKLNDVWEDRRTSGESLPVEFETRVSYPAGSFLFASPFLGMGLEDLRYFYLGCAVLAFGAILWRTGKEAWPVVLLVALASLEFWNDIASGGTGSLCLLFLVLGWLTMRKNLWLSASFMGLAAASKQLAWFFIPFYLILLLRTIGFKKCAQSAAVIGGCFLILNLAFIVDDPGNWFSSVFAPMIDPMFPRGVGLVNLSLAGIVPEGSHLMYAVAEILVFGLCLVAYYLCCRRYPNAGLVLAVLPLFFAWRSYSAYLYPAAILVFAAVMADWKGHSHQSPSSDAQQDPGCILFPSGQPHPSASL